MCITQLLNNASVSAFLGAFFAFGLVYLNDRRRLERKKKLLYRHIKIIKQQAEVKLKIIQNNRNDLSANNNVIPAPILNFQVNILKTFEIEVLDLLKDDELLSFEGICYYLEATDGIINELYDYKLKVVESVRQGNLKKSESGELVKHNDNLLRLFNEAEINLSNIGKMCDSFLKKKYNEILDGAQNNAS